MNWQPTMDWETAKERAALIAKIRSFFHDREVIEVETPIISQNTVTDVHMDVFTTLYEQGNLELQNKPLYLQTSPEYGMKRLLAAGYQSIYQIAKAFRNEPHGRYHNPEFTMLEWYRLDFDHHLLMDEVTELLKVVLPITEVEKVTYQNVFQRVISVDPLEANLEELKLCLKKHDIEGDWINSEVNKDILLQVAFSEIIEPVIGRDCPVFVYDFPASQASLAKISDKDSRVASRFECYYKGVELANGFDELSSASEQLQRFQEDNEHRKSLNRQARVVDRRFIAALENGLPQCAGVALGIDRLVMLALDMNDIKSSITFNIESA